MDYLIINKDPKSHIAEAFRGLRTNIQFVSFEKEVKSILITSPLANEGKTTTACNLAVSMAQLNKKVLLIDCDMRRASIHKLFGISNDIGLSDMLINNKELKDVIIEVDTNLHLLTSGTIPPNPSEILMSKAMEDLITETQTKYDMVILDSPPVVIVTDACALANKVNGILLVISSEVTSIEEGKKAKDLLKAVNGNILGVIINNVHNKNKYKYYDDEKIKKKKRKKIWFKRKKDKSLTC